MKKVFTFLVGQSCCSALKSWAARQRRPTKDVKIIVMRTHRRHAGKVTVMAAPLPGRERMRIFP